MKPTRVAAVAPVRSMPSWTVEGTFYARRGYWQPFSKHCEADSGERAREWALSEIGGCHGVKRHQIRISRVAESGSG